MAGGGEGLIANPICTQADKTSKPSSASPRLPPLQALLRPWKKPNYGAENSQSPHPPASDPVFGICGQSHSSVWLFHYIIRNEVIFIHLAKKQIIPFLRKYEPFTLLILWGWECLLFCSGWLSVLGSLGSCWRNEVQSPVCFREKYLISFFLPIYMGNRGLVERWKGKVNGTSFLFYRREKTKRLNWKTGSIASIPKVLMFHLGHFSRHTCSLLLM